MMKNILLKVSILVSVFLMAPNAYAQTNGPIIVELFTSQGCSSCPPADQIMNQLSQNPNFIPLSYHVTYWDHLNWKDTLGRKFADDRQRSYSNYKRANRVYTPQMIINGDKEFVGSRKHEANTNLSNAKPISQISLTGATPQGTMLSLPDVSAGDYYLWIAGVKKAHVEKIARGENRGKLITYNNTVITLDRAERWDGKSKTINVQLNKSGDIDHYVIFAQNKAYGEIVAAGQFKI